MCHVAGRETIHGYDSFDIRPSRVRRHLRASGRPVSDASVVAGMLNTRHLDDDAAADAVAGYSAALDAPATDPVRHGVPDEVLDAILRTGPSTATTCRCRTHRHLAGDSVRPAETATVVLTHEGTTGLEPIFGATDCDAERPVGHRLSARPSSAR